MSAFTASSMGMCSACFNPYRRGDTLVSDRTGKVRHERCGYANMVASAAERREQTQKVSPIPSRR